MAKQNSERKKWTDSDFALAFVMFKSVRPGAPLGDKQFKIVARSRVVQRSHSSWSQKITNYIQADDLLAGRTTKAPYSGNAERSQAFLEYRKLWEVDPEQVRKIAASEVIIRDSEALDFFIKLGFKDNQLAKGQAIDFSRVSQDTVLTSVRNYDLGDRADGFRDSAEYDLLIDQRTYPPKMIMGMAYKLATGETITGTMFEGGLNTPCFRRFEELGFKLIPKKTPPKYNFMNYEQRLICALAAKPFVILAGGTGTGKTKSAIETVKKLCKPLNDGEVSDQFEVISVGADWTDTRPLLGYVNLLIENGPAYSAPAAMKLILRAHKEPNLPYFLILDEMNLSHVERYFSDFLSLMEAKKIDKTAACIKLHSQTGGMKAAEGGTELIPAEIPWPTNLFVIGTVNIDETTHMFSPKVLDRAHVIEYKVQWDAKGTGPRDILSGLDQMVAKSVKSGPDSNYSESLSPILVKSPAERLIGISTEPMNECKAVIGKIWTRLNGTRFAFSHRTAQEAIGFVLIASELSASEAGSNAIGRPSIEELIDLAVLQKILPKINGSAETLASQVQEGSKQGRNLLEQLKEEDCKGLPGCVEKLDKMIDTLKREHFVSFIQ